MHGLIHNVFKGYIVETFGANKWREICRRVDVVDDAMILRMEQYDDELTLAAITVACNATKQPIEGILESFGAYFVGFAANNGYLNMLKSLGRSFQELVSNLNLLHHNIERDFPSAIFPSFEMEFDDSLDMEVPGSNKTFLLKYGTSRSGFQPLVRGVLTKVAKVLFDEDLKIEDVTSVERGPSSNCFEATSITWRCTLQKRTADEAVIRPSLGSDSESDSCHISLDQDENHHGKTAPFRVQAPTCGFFDLHAALVSVWGCHCWQAVDETLEGVCNSKHKKILSLMGEYNVNTIFSSLSSKLRLEIAAILFRGVRASKVSSVWTNATDLDRTTAFWEQYIKLDEFYELSCDWADLADGMVQKRDGKILFLSQSWGAPKEWDSIMSISYAMAKAAEICVIAKDIASQDFGSASEWESVNLWVDKCCIPQGHTDLEVLCVNALEEFIVLCDGLIVLAPWSYFTRLWCVYEWVCFLLAHDPLDLIVCADPFIRESTLPLYLDTIRNFSLERCQCAVEADRRMLDEKVDAYYVSRRDFESFLQFSVIALLSRTLAARRSAKAQSSLLPWVHLAAELGFDNLALSLDKLSKNIGTWRDNAILSARTPARREDDCSTSDVQTRLSLEIDIWFRENIAPDIAVMRKAVSKPNALKTVELQKSYVNRV